MIAVSLAFLSSLIYGISDFTGGLAARRSSALRTAALSSVAGLGFMTIAVLALGGVWSREAILWGGLSGVASCFVFVFLYRALAIGPMGILSPVIAVAGAVVPLVFSEIRGDRLSVLGWVGIALALAAVAVVSFAYDPEHHRPSVKGVLLALGCGVAVGTVFILLSATPADSGVVPVVANRVLTTVALGGVALAWGAHRRHEGVPRRVTIMALAAGALDTSANLLFLAAARGGSLGMVAVITSLYPAGTVVCARMILKERMTPVQFSGLLAAGVAVVLLALA